MTDANHGDAAAGSMLGCVADAEADVLDHLENPDAITIEELIDASNPEEFDVPTKETRNGSRGGL